ncbi:MAG TPA: ribosome maturation factor RimM [Xanthobacteraceae bacterium]|nr:ribosome maturation factor RimM [Xanthobacteraceae bacterium]
MVERICVARIGAAHGVKGEVRLWSFTADPAAVAGYGPLESEDGTQRFEIEAMRPAKDHLVARLSGVRDRDAAERLVNVRLYVARDRLPAPAPEEFYHADLIGLRAESRDGAALATIVGIHDFGAGDLLELRPLSGGGTVLMPFTAQTVPEVDIAGGRIIIDPPQDLFK